MLNSTGKLFLSILILPFFLNISYGQPDFEEIGREGARILGDILKLDTTNPPGNEYLVADYLQNVAEMEGLKYIRLWRDEGRDNFIARYHGSGAKEPLLIYSHSDVVPADYGWGTWAHDPFSGEVNNGSIYGRGAIDAKGLLVSHLMALILLKRENISLDRDIIFLAAASEESGGGPGVAWLLDEKKEYIDCEIALGEGGRVWTRGDSVWTVWIQTGEKAAHNLTVMAIGEPGHASVPSAKNAIDRLVRALDKMNDYKFDRRYNDVNRTFKKILSPYEPRLKKYWERYYAMTHTSLAVTMISGGIKSNVVPDMAEANVNLRLMPEDDLDEVVGILNKEIDDENVTVTRKPWAKSRASTQSFDTEYYEAISKAAKEMWPEAVIAPYLSPGTSDASKLRSEGILTYGLMPFPMTEEESEGIHGVDESICLEALTEGIKFTYKIILETSASTVNGINTKKF